MFTSSWTVQESWDTYTLFIFLPTCSLLLSVLILHIFNLLNTDSKLHHSNNQVLLHIDLSTVVHSSLISGCLPLGLFPFCPKNSLHYFLQCESAVTNSFSCCLPKNALCNLYFGWIILCIIKFQVGGCFLLAFEDVIPLVSGFLYFCCGVSCHFTLLQVMWFQFSLALLELSQSFFEYLNFLSL